MKATLKNRKKILVTAGAVLILLISLGILAYNVACSEMRLIHSSMTSTMSTFENKYKRAESIQEIAADMNEKALGFFQYLQATAFRETGDVQTALDALEKDYFDCYLIDTSGKCYAAKEATELSLSKEQLNGLLSDKSMTEKADGNTYYYSAFDMPE